MLHHDASVLDEIDAGLLGQSLRFIVADAALKPHPFGTNRNGRTHHVGAGVWPPENVHDIHRSGHLLKGGVAGKAHHRVMFGIDGKDLLADRLQVAGDAVTGAGRVVAEADDSDALGRQHPTNGGSIVALASTR